MYAHTLSHHKKMLAGAAAAAGKRPALSLLRLGRGVGIREQLWLEEALLRHDARNWCVRMCVRARVCGSIMRWAGRSIDRVLMHRQI